MYLYLGQSERWKSGEESPHSDRVTSESVKCNAPPCSAGLQVYMEKWEQLYILLISDLEEYADSIIQLPDSRIAKFDKIKIEYKSDDVTISVNKKIYRKVSKIIAIRETKNV